MPFSRYDWQYIMGNKKKEERNILRNIKIKNIQCK